MLHYLDLEEHKKNPEMRNLNHINGYLLSNWPQTTALLTDLIRKGYVRLDDNQKTYSITDEGHARLLLLRRAFDGFLDEKLEAFIRRAGR